MRYLVLGVQELLESRRFDFDLKLDFVLFFELVSGFSVASEAAAVFEAVVAVEAAEQSRTRLALDCEVVEEASIMVLLSDELVALPSSLSEAESPAAAAAAEAVEAAAATAGAIEAVGVEGRWPSLRLRISGLSDTVLIFNFPSSSWVGVAIRLPLSEVSNSSPLQEKKNRKLHKVHKQYILVWPQI